MFKLFELCQRCKMHSFKEKCLYVLAKYRFMIKPKKRRRKRGRYN